MEPRLLRIRELITQQEAIENELNTLIAGGKERKPQQCSKCGQTGHTARTCAAEREQ